MIRRPPRSPLFPYPPLFRSQVSSSPPGPPPVPTLPADLAVVNVGLPLFAEAVADQGRPVADVDWRIPAGGDPEAVAALRRLYGDRKSTRLNSSHLVISYAVF